MALKIYGSYLTFRGFLKTFIPIQILILVLLYDFVFASCSAAICLIDYLHSIEESISAAIELNKLSKFCGPHKPRETPLTPRDSSSSHV